MALSIKKSASGTVLIIDFSSKQILKELTEEASLTLSEKTPGGVWVIDSKGQEFNIEAAFPVPFVGDVRDLYELLELSFFYNLLNPPTAGGVNIYNSNGTLTADRTLSGANFNLSLLGLNEFIKDFNIKEEIIGDQKIRTLAYDLTANGTTPQNLILIPLNIDFDSVSIYGRVLYRKENQDGIGRVNFWGACTRNAGGVLELDNNNIQELKNNSIPGQAPDLNHTTSGSNYIITIDPNSLVFNLRFFVWLELHCANILV
jgi:hypothetical protein